ncbi:hypothetical protein [Nakamurella lactea]|uniref:hypothetical protein n=1 Tax=Nakamurella lactea TaxID=459515 RepID=UPI0003FAB457|nr:hypothetical protein [Nakamurella lactea]
MPAETTVKHQCGHSEQRDLSTKKPFERAGFAAWLAKQPCRDCDPKQIRKKQEWVAAKRAEESREARAAEKKFGLEPLDGPEKIQDWAMRIRVDLITKAFEALDLDEADFDEQVASPAGQVNAAGWWLDHRDIDPSVLSDELTAALTDDAATTSTGTQNPY